MQYDYAIIGSGFGGSVCGLRLVDKGYSVLMLEKGRRFRAEDFPETNWNLKRWMWRPEVGFRGLFSMTFLRHVTALSGVGVGGGSLVYANTLPIPKDAFFREPSWGDLADWKTELTPHYTTARRMLGAVETPVTTYPDEVMREVGRDIGREDGFERSTVAVYFGEPGKTVPDPYFGGEGPDRTGCIQCGACMTGCRHEAKNTLDKNYLYLAENRGLRIESDTEVTWVRPDGQGGYELETRQGRPWRRQPVRYRARNVVFAGGVLGTVELLLRLQESADGLPGLSARLGDYVRTNSEVLIGVVSRDRNRDLSRGIAIGSILHTDERSHIEPVRYGDGSGFFRLMAMPHAPGASLPTRLANAIGFAVRHPGQTLRAWTVPNWARRTMILLYMRTAEGHLSLRLGRDAHNLFRRGLVSELGSGAAPEASLPEASELARRVAEKIDGYPQSMMTETFFGTPTTAHILGGCVMGDSPDRGVIDHRHRVFGHDGLYVIDGSAVSANPGVNPSLTIAALAERAMSFIPSKST